MPRLLQATRASEQAKSAVVQNSAALQAKLDEKERLLSALDRAKMQEALNDARGQFEDALDHDVPSFAEVERKIRDREAVAQAKGELGELQRPQVDPAVLEIEAASRAPRRRRCSDSSARNWGCRLPSRNAACSNAESRRVLLAPSCGLARRRSSLDPSAHAVRDRGFRGNRWRTRR